MTTAEPRSDGPPPQLPWSGCTGLALSSTATRPSADWPASIVCPVRSNAFRFPFRYWYSQITATAGPGPIPGAGAARNEPLLAGSRGAQCMVRRIAAARLARTGDGRLPDPALPGPEHDPSVSTAMEATLAVSMRVTRCIPSVRPAGGAWRRVAPDKRGHDRRLAPCPIAPPFGMLAARRVDVRETGAVDDSEQFSRPRRSEVVLAAHHARDRLAAQEAADVLRGFARGRQQDAGDDARIVRRAEHVGQVEEREAGAEFRTSAGLVPPGVDPRAELGVLDQVPVECLLVEDRAARDVDHDGGRLRQRELPGADEATRRAGERQRDHDDVGDSEHRVQVGQRADEVHVLVRPPRRVDRVNERAERPHEGGGRRADAAEAQDRADRAV